MTAPPNHLSRLANDRPDKFRRNLFVIVSLALLFVTASRATAADVPKPAGLTPLAAEPGTPKNIADLKALEDRVRQVVVQVSPSVVSVAGGSGVCISSDGFVLTVAHVAVRAGRHITIIFPDGRRARAITLGNDHGADAGMMKITDPGPWPHVEMASSSTVKVGQWCMTLGYPITFQGGRSPVVRIGRVSLTRKNEIITDGSIMGGDSGAPLFNLDGKVVAIGSMCGDSLKFNIHVPMDRYSDSWDRLAQSEDFDSVTQKPLLGVTAAEDTDQMKLASVVPNSAADRAGLLAGDILLKFDGAEIHKPDDLPPLVQKRKPGDRVEIEYRRGADTRKVGVKLGAVGPGESK